MSATRRIVGGLLLVLSVLCLGLGAQLWSSERSDVHTRERLSNPCPVAAAGSGGCLGPYQDVVTGFKPNRVPALLAFVVGGTLGVIGVVLVGDASRKRSTRHAERGP